jgi:hypothetical protein
MTSEKKFFPINTETACQLKWSWSTLLLNSGITRSCYRSSESKLTPENFHNFHNTPEKIADRKKMLAGEWPGGKQGATCHYCKEIEAAGGVSDRLWHLSIPNMYPRELDQNSTAVEIKPVVVEVFLNNTCQLSCLYCSPDLSSTINNENRRFGQSKIQEIEFAALEVVEEPRYTDLLPAFQQWFEKEFKYLRRLNILGGEPFFQKEFDKILDYVDQFPNADCELNIVSNLMIPPALLEKYIVKIRKLLINRKLKSLQILASIDCWGPQQEYVRYGLDLVHWEKNFRYLLDQKWIKLALNQVFSPLTIKTAPELMHKLKEWRQVRHVSLYSGTISPDPSYFIPKHFGPGVFEEDFQKIVSAMPIDTDEDQVICNYIEGIGKGIANHQRDWQEIKKMLIYINEKDQRRGTNWRELFPWLIEIEKQYMDNYVV